MLFASVLWSSNSTSQGEKQPDAGSWIWPGRNWCWVVGGSARDCAKTFESIYQPTKAFGPKRLQPQEYDGICRSVVMCPSIFDRITSRNSAQTISVLAKAAKRHACYGHHTWYDAESVAYEEMRPSCTWNSLMNWYELGIG